MNPVLTGIVEAVAPSGAVTLRRGEERIAAQSPISVGPGELVRFVVDASGAALVLAQSGPVGRSVLELRRVR